MNKILDLEGAPITSYDTWAKAVIAQQTKDNTVEVDEIKSDKVVI